MKNSTRLQRPSRALACLFLLLLGLQGYAFAQDPEEPAPTDSPQQPAAAAPAPKNATLLSSLNQMPANLELYLLQGSLNEIKQSTDLSFYQMVYLRNNGNVPLKLTNFKPSEMMSLQRPLHHATTLLVDGQRPKDTLILLPKVATRLEISSTLLDTGTWVMQLQGRVFPQSGDSAIGSIFQQFGVNISPSTKVPVRPKPSFVIEEIAVTNAASGMVSLRAYIRDTSGMAHSIQLPSCDLALSGEGNARFQAKYDSVSYQVDGKPLLGSFILQKDAQMAISITFHGLCTVGNYTGNLNVQEQGSQSQSQPFVVNVKASIWLAILLIALGVLGGYGLTYFKNKLRPRLVYLRSALQLQDDMAEAKSRLQPLGADEQLLHDSLTNSCNRLVRQLDYELPADVTNGIALLQAKLNVFISWVQMQRMVDSLQPATLRTAEMTTPLAAASAYLYDGNAKTTDAAAQQNTLAAIPALVKAALSAKMKDALAELSQMISDNDLPASLEAEVQALTTAMTAGQNNPTALKAQYTALQGKIAVALAEKLSALLVTCPIKNVDPTRWNTTKTKITAQIAQVAGSVDAGTAIATYNAASDLYVAEMLDLLKSALQKLGAGTDTVAVAAVQATIDAATQAITDDDDASAKAKLSEAIDLYNDLGADRSTEGATRSLENFNLSNFAGSAAGGPQKMSLAGLLGYDAEGQARMSKMLLGLHKPRNADEVTRLLVIAELVSTFTILLLSTLIGIMTFYNTSATWGSLNDMILSFLWGFGLHTISKTTDFSGGVFNVISGKFGSGAGAGVAPIAPVADPATEAPEENGENS